MSQASEPARSLTDARDYPVVDRHGTHVGTVNQLYVRAATGEPGWIAIAGGLYGMAVYLAPAELARVEKDTVVINASAPLITHAPAIDPSDGITDREESLLQAHYSGTREWD